MSFACSSLLYSAPHDGSTMAPFSETIDTIDFSSLTTVNNNNNNNNNNNSNNGQRTVRFALIVPQGSAQRVVVGSGLATPRLPAEFCDDA